MKKRSAGKIVFSGTCMVFSKKYKKERRTTYGKYITGYSERPV